MNNSTNLTTFYDQYKNAGISMDLIVAVGIRAILAFIGILMNLSLLYVTIRTKSLRSICNILIAIDTFAITIFLPINIFGFAIVLSGLNFIPSSICCYIIQPLPQIGLNFSVMSILFIAIDRFLSVFQPIWHASRKKTTYIFVICCFCLFYALFMLQMFIRNVNPRNPTICSLASDCMQNGIGSQYSTNLVVLNGLTIGFYVGIWIFMRIRAKNAIPAAVKNQITYTRRIFKPLAALISFYMIGYVINSIIRLFIYPILNLSPVQAAFASSYLTAFSNLTMFCNGPILYLFSTEYRKGFDNVFGWKSEPTVVTRVIPHSTTLNYSSVKY